jgi:hypothetical protein
MPDFAEVMRPHLESALDPGETLEGVCAAAQQSAFKGRALALGVTDRRLLILPLDRRGRPTDEVIAIGPDEIASVKAQGAGGGWANVAPAVMSSAAVTIELRTMRGEKHKLNLMRGTGVFGKLGGGEPQRQGIEALGSWFETNRPHS